MSTIRSGILAMGLVSKICHSILQLCLIFHISLLYQIQKSGFICPIFYKYWKFWWYIISGDFKRYFKPELYPILSIIFMLLSFYKSQARNRVLYCWVTPFDILQAKSLTVPLFWGNTRISAITSRKYVYSVFFPGSCLSSVKYKSFRAAWKFTFYTFPWCSTWYKKCMIGDGV